MNSFVEIWTYLLSINTELGILLFGILMIFGLVVLILGIFEIKNASTKLGRKMGKITVTNGCSIMALGIFCYFYPIYFILLCVVLLVGLVIWELALSTNMGVNKT